MTILKKFFDENNSLNKGYEKKHSPSNNNHKFGRARKYERFLPPIDVITEYEHIYPGTLGKIITMAEQEQSATHKMRNQQLEIDRKTNEYSKKIIIIITTLICLASTIIIIAGKIIPGLIFAFMAFFFLSIIPNRFSSKKTKS